MQIFSSIPSPYKEIISIVSCLIISSGAAYLTRNIFKRLIAKLEPKNKFWNKAFLKAAYKPASYLIFFLGITLSASLFAHHVNHEDWITSISIVRNVGIVGFFVWFLLAFIRQGEKAFIKATSKKRKDETTVKAVGQVMKISVILISTLVVLQTVGIPVSGVLAFGGIGGIAVGFAAKDLLANFFGGLMIFLDRPFALGDWIRSPDKEIEGIVEDIGWRLTRVRTLDRRPLYVPNSYFLTISIENPSRMSHRRIKTTVGVRYCDAKKIPALIQEIENAMKSNEHVDENRPCFASLSEFGPSSLNILLYAFSKKTTHIDFAKMQSELFLEILDVIEKCGAEVAFPTSTIHLSEDKKKAPAMSLADVFSKDQ